MSYDNDSAMYSLTPDGWVSGDNIENAVEVWRRTVFQASPWSREQISWSCEWVNDSVDLVERDRLRGKYKEFMGEPGRRGDREVTIGDPL